jgi:hypothetical protein
LKPGFFKNADLAEVPFEGRILFQGLWCLADRRGRLIDRPKQIKGEVLPYDDVSVPPLLDALQNHGLILRYETKGNRYIQIVNFEKHQYPHIKEAESTIPAPYKNRTSTSLIRLNPESPILNPSSLNPDVPITTKPPAAPDFEKVWSLYPRRKGRKAAQRHFKATVKTAVDFQNVLRALENYKQSKEVKEGFIQNGSTWFNNWEDWLEGDRNGTDERKSIFGLPDKKGGEGGYSRLHSDLRKAASAGEVFAGVRNLPVPSQDREEKSSERDRDRKPNGAGH